MLRFLFLCCLTVLCFSCGGVSDFAYNEAATQLYFQVSDNYEELYAEVIEKGLKTKYDVRDQSSTGFKDVAIKNLRDNTMARLAHLDKLSPSEAALPIHRMFQQYMKMVSEDFVELSYKYANLNCACPEQREAIVLEIKQLNAEINAHEVSQREQQKQYLIDLGFAPKERGEL